MDTAIVLLSLLIGRLTLILNLIAQYLYFEKRGNLFQCVGR